MTKDDSIRMAREVSDVTEDSHGRESFGFDYYGLEAFASLVAAHEREACAKVCEDKGYYSAVVCADAIRARSQS
jgi:hypothetical protein